MSHELAHRIYDFLKDYPPFNFLDKKEILSLASRCTVKYVPKDSIIFSAGDIPPQKFYQVKEGAIQLFQGENTLVETCDEGDVFGIRPLLAQSPYLLTARAGEETLLYVINTEDFLPLIQKHPKISWYLATNFAVGAGNQYNKIPVNDTQNIFQEKVWTEVSSIQGAKIPVTCSPEFSIQDAAKKMVAHKVSSIIICDENQHPLGIITDKDLRTKVVAGDIRKKETVDKIYSSPLICARPNPTHAEIQLLMLKNKIGHIVITMDGTMATPCIGVISEHDIIIQGTESPAFLLKEIQKAPTLSKLISIRKTIEKLIEKWLDQEISIRYITRLVSTLQDEIIRKVISISVSELSLPEGKMLQYCWLSLGSEGREEQLLKTDQDNAIIFEENPSFPEQKDYLLILAKKVNDALNEIGFEYCPANMMASNPEWCLSLAEWKNKFRYWITQPGEKEIMMCTIFFDFRPVFGEESLARTLSDYIFSLLDQQEVFLRFLAQNALQNPPPLSFFRNFMVEKSGEQKDLFDVKLKALMPIVDAARLLILEKRISGIHNTGDRLEAIASKDKNNEDMLRLTADAFDIILKVRTLHGLKNQNSGRYIQPEDMDKLSKLQLRNAFQPIDDIQKMIKIRFQL